MMRFDRFTERAQEAAQRAAEIIQRYGHNQIDTEHILLALIEQPQGVVPQILEGLKVDSNALTERLDYILRTSPKANIFGGGAGQVFITPRVKRIIDLANEEANKLKDEYISTEHIFLAILSERSTPAARLLEGAGVTRERVYEFSPANPRRTTRDRSAGRDALPYIGTVLARPDPDGTRGQA